MTKRQVECTVEVFRKAFGPLCNDSSSAGPSPEISCQINQTLITLFGGSGTDFLTYTLLTFKKGEVLD